MKNYFDQFIQLSLQQCTKNDYIDAQKVKAHNKALKKMQQLQEEMKQIGCLDILHDLLLYEDDSVRINAASLCLQMNVHVECALNALNSVISTSSDPTTCFSARMILQSMS